MADLTTADVDAIKQFLLGTREDLLTWLPSGPWVPGWKSEAAAELRNVETRADTSPWGEDPIRTAYAAADMFIRATIDCLDALADSTNLLTTIYVPHVLARAAMEAALSDNGTMVGVKEPIRASLSPLAVPMSLGAWSRECL